MTMRQTLARITANDSFNYLVTNHIPRAALTRLVGRFSKIEQPLVKRLSIGVWKLFSDLDLGEARDSHFKSMHACFTRSLKDGARTIDMRAEVLSSPSDAIVGACGTIESDTLIQAKGMPYSMAELVKDKTFSEQFIGGTYITLRLTSSMYHRFHAPYDCTIEQVNYISGDVWNVNPPALKRIASLFCKNERAVLHTRMPDGKLIAMVPVAAVLVASIRLHFANVLLHLKYRGPNIIPCNHHAKKGEELGWFEHGSTIIVLVPNGYKLADGIDTGLQIKMGQPLLQRLSEKTNA
jgi:phosphatidylserine decarboxylase